MQSNNNNNNNGLAGRFDCTEPPVEVEQHPHPHAHDPSRVSELTLESIIEKEKTTAVKVKVLPRMDSQGRIHNSHLRGPDQQSLEIDKDTEEVFDDTNSDSNHADSNSLANKQELPFWLDVLTDWIATFTIGSLVATYWRGTWVLLDILTCDQPPSASLLNGESFCFSAVVPLPEIHYTSAWQTYLAGCLLLFVGLFAMSRQWWQPSSMVEQSPKVITRQRALVRLVIIYILGLATVCIWHGIWYFLDYFLLVPNAEEPNMVASYWTSCAVGAGFCFLLMAGNSLLAPPAIFLVDGPSRNAPPIATTILTSYRSIAFPSQEGALLNSQDPIYIVVLDMLVSYIALPWGVVGFWRGFWLLMDAYLWGFTLNSQDIYMSILYSVLLGILCLGVASEDLIQYMPTSSTRHALMTKVINEIIGRVRTLILAVGTVNFWRAVWYIWDEFWGQSYPWSAALSHVIGVFGLTLLGCACCISAPPSTSGVDAVAHPDCADEPLFFNVPIASEALYFLSIGRQPIVREPQVQQAELPLPMPSPPSRASSVSSFAARMSRQSTAHVSMATRADSVTSTTSALTRRHLMVRQKSQFFRNR